LRFETAEVSLLGDREENQDRAAICRQGDGVLLVVADGMGGHSDGALAAEIAVDSLCRSFSKEAPDGQGGPEFLRAAIEAAHDAVVAVGEKVGIGRRPRATCAVCMVRDGVASWAHVGDSRVYLLRAGVVVTRTRDHTPIENLLQDGLISEDEVAGHPMRHYVEYCLGGVAELPHISVSAPLPLEPGDLLMVCSDGLWSGVPDEEIATGPEEGLALEDWLVRIAGRAIRLGAPYSDNTTAVAYRALADQSSPGQSAPGDKHP
jgi:PPM family protein phosphatase